MTDRPTWTTERRKLGDLREWERNPRELSKHDAEHLARSIEKFNLADPLVINQDGQIIGGHQRKRVMLANGYAADDLVDVRVPSRQLTDREAAELNIRLNRNAGAFDWDILANQFEVADLLDWGFTDFDLEMHDMAEEPEPADDPGAQLDRAAELQEKWQVERGQVWTAGQHRVMCGDSTCAEDVARLMAGERAAMLFTDPPYGVDYRGGHFHSGDVNIVREREPLAGDKGDVYTKFLPIVPGNVDGPCYVWFASSVGKPVYDAILSNGCEIHAMIIWHKTNSKYAAINAQYKQRHEPCLYFKPKGSTLRWCGPTDECTLWEMDRLPSNENHPTEKPPTLAVRAIKNHTADTVLDLFLGSGTTIVACEQTGRRGFGMEICEKYVSVTLQRLADMGLEPRLAE